MKKRDFLYLFDLISPKLLQFAAALNSDTEKSEKLVTDALSVFLLREKSSIVEGDFSWKSETEKKSVSDYLFKEMLRDIYSLGHSRYGVYQAQSISFESSDQSHSAEYNLFYDLKIKSRSVLFLKERMNFSIEDIQEVFEWQRPEVIQHYYNARNELLASSEECHG